MKKSKNNRKGGSASAKAADAQVSSMGSVETTPSETTLGTFETGQDKKTQQSSKPKTGLLGFLARKFGYVKRDQEALWINDIYKEVAAEGMDEEKFAALSLNEKIKALKDRVGQLMSAHESETPNVAVAETNVPVETKNPVEVEAQSNEKVDENQTEPGVNSIDAAQGEVITETTEIQSSGNNSAGQSSVESGQKKNNQSEEDATSAPKNKSIDSDEQEGTDVVGDVSKTLESEFQKLKEEKKALEGENSKLTGKNATLKKEKENLEREKGALEVKNGQLTGENATLRREKGKLESENEELNTKHVTLSGEYSKLQIAHDQYKRCKELEESEVGQLEVTVTEKDQEITRLQEEKNAVEQELSEEQSAKNAINQQLQEARRTIENQKGALREKKEDIRILNSAVKEKEKQICDLKMANNGLNAEIEGQQNELAARQTTIDLQAEEIGKLKEDKDSLQSENTALNRLVEGLQQEKEELTRAKRTAEQELDTKNKLICAERDDFAKMMMSLTKKLSAAAAEDFLGCCDDNFEDNRTSLQEKVLKPIRRLEREMAEIKPENYASRDELVEAYHALIKSQFNEPSGLTRIAQWYAYSQVAFMVDKDRADGLFIYQEKVRDMYRLAVRLMGNVGLEYCLPALYAEHLSGNSPYDNVTGQRQLNIEYMCPTARGRKENIDCIDRSQVIIDIVEVGYTDAKGVSKKSQVII